MASSSANGSIYDVFLSFRGEDTRNTFTDHLYEALVRAGLRTFRDDDELDRGQELKPNIKRAIKESRASIVVLSENYATSTWCLDELLLILEQRSEYNQFVLPVFYHVDPSDVRKQNNTFKISVKAYSRWTGDNVKMWKVALTNIANLTGLVLSGPETTFLKKIVDTIYKELDCKEVHLPSNLIGMVARREEINSWLDKHRLEFLAICGMGGSGKTTLAKYIYDSNWKKFENTSFLEDIGTKCERPNGMLELQEQLLEDILGGKKIKLHGISQGTSKIEKALETKRMLIVLDDMVEHSQLVALLGNGKINARSKIIITTRENTESWFKLTTWRCQDYRMVLLNDGESLELLSRHSFGSKSPLEAFNELAMQAVRYCEGNPLALKVLASSLSIKNTILHWRSQLNLLERDGDDGIQGVLIRSFMSLPSDSEKELFLHIACFFIGEDMDYVEKILEPDYSAICGIKTLINRYLLSVSSNKKLMMHRLLQEMGKNIVRQESSKRPEKRSRIWLNSDSYKILSKGKGSKTIEGLALDMQTLRKEDIFKSSDLKTDALQNMDKLKLLQLNFVELTGSYEKFSEDLRWLCWFGFHSRTIPYGLFMGRLVALDMSYSKLEVFEPPMVLVSLKILNLKDSYHLSQIRNIFRIPNLETFMLCNCHSLVNVCETIGDLTKLALLNMTGCENLCTRDRKNVPSMLTPSTSNSGEVKKQRPFSFPRSLQRLFLKDCNLDCTISFPLSFSVQPALQYLNLGNSLFESLPCYDHLKDLRVLDLSLCSKLKELLYLPCTLAELYIYYCKSLEKITFQSHRFTLQEFGYEGCSNLSEVEDFIKLVPIAKLHETDLGHMVWLMDYKDHEMCLVGDDELTFGRSKHAQMLYEFNIMSTSLPDVKDLRMTPEYISESQFLSFQVPMCPKGRRLKGLNITFKYTLFGKDWAWFTKISTTNGVELMYNPKVFGKTEFGEVAIWLSYWPIGNKLDAGDGVNVSIVVINGLEICNCGASLVYDDEVVDKTLQNKMEWGEILGGDFSGFRLSTGAYYLCRRDFFELVDIDRSPPGWFWDLVGDIIDYTEIQGWRKTGRRKELNPSSTELRTVRYTIHDPELEEKMPEMSKSSFVDKPVEYRSTTLGEKRKYDTTYPTRPEVSSSTKSAAAGQPSGQVLHGTSGSMSPQVQGRNQQLPGSAPEIKTEMNPILNPRAAGPEGSLIGIPGSNQGGNNLTLKGWPLTGLDQLRPGLLQQQKSYMQGSQPLHQLQMLTPQHQQQLLLAQHNMTSQSANDESLLRMFLNNRSISMNKDGLSNSVGDVVPNLGSSMPVLPRGDPDMLLKLKMAQQLQQQQQQQQQNGNQQQQQQHLQHSLSAPLIQNSNLNLQQEKILGTSSVTGDGSMSNSFRGNDQTGRKRKQPVTSSGPANSTGTANTAGPSPSSAPSTPSTHTPGDVISMPALPHNGSSSKSLLMFGADGPTTLTSPSNQLADMDRFVEDGSLDDNVESFLSHDDTDPRDTVGRCMDVSKKFTFTEVNSVRASASKVVCCHFSSDGKLLASGGHDKKAVLWYTDSLKPKSTLEEHSSLITDVRFSPSMPRLATSSFDKTVRVWDADNPGFSLRTFIGHSASVMSLDFHPNKDDIICSCDGDGEIRYWSINNRSCARVFKGGTAQVRFQPRHGRYLAAAAENIVSILDVETQACRHSLQGHTKPIYSVCWDPKGEYLASVSEDSVRVWSLMSGNEGECIHDLSCNGNKFHSCVFHPSYASLLVIGCYQSLELWNMSENKSMTLSAHEGLIAGLALSTVTGLVASASHDKIVKLWK